MTTSTQALQTIDRVTKSLAKITTLEEAKELRDQASALREYYRASERGRVLANRATFVKIMCERRAGQLLAEVPRKQGNRKGEKGLRSLLEQSGIPPSTAHNWQAYAKVPVSEFEDLLAECNEEEEDFLTMFAVSMVNSWLERHEKPKKKRTRDQGTEEEEEEREEEAHDAADDPGPGGADDTAEAEDTDPGGVDEADPRQRLLDLLTEAVELCPKVEGFERKRSVLRKWVQALEGGGG